MITFISLIIQPGQTELLSRLRISMHCVADPDDPHDLRNWYKPVFKVPIELIADTFWNLLESDFMELQDITRSIYGSNELGGTMPVNKSINELLEMWWGTGPTPASLRRRHRLRGW